MISSSKEKSGRRRLLLGSGVLLLVGLIGSWWASTFYPQGNISAKAQGGPVVSPGVFRPTDTQWSSLVVQPVAERVFQTEIRTEGKIAVDEDHATPVFSPFGGRISKLLVAPGDRVRAGDALFVVEAADFLQAQNDFIGAVSGLNKAQSQVTLTSSVERRMQELFSAKAGALKDWQQAQADAAAAQNDLRSAKSTLEAARNRLKILGKTDAEIDTFRDTGSISSQATVYSPINGTVLLRKAGPGQFIVAGAADPVFLIGDTATVWLTAFIREADAQKVELGQSINFAVLADPDGGTRDAKIDYIASTIDATSRRLPVRAVIKNADGKLKPEMFANVSVFVGTATPSVAVPSEAIIREGSKSRIWVVSGDRTLAVRDISTGLSQEGQVQVKSGLSPSDKIVIRGSLFIDRAASGS